VENEGGESRRLDKVREGMPVSSLRNEYETILKICNLRVSSKDGIRWNVAYR
jgi:hypothetical protein